MSERQDVTGGCLCGDIRFKLSGSPHLAEYCHCDSCRKAAGAPVVAWAGVGLGQFEITVGSPECYASSPGVERTFCKRNVQRRGGGVTAANFDDVELLWVEHNR